jgi:hypothetical protein
MKNSKTEGNGQINIHTTGCALQIMGFKRHTYQADK